MLHNFTWFGIRWAALSLLASVFIDLEFLIANLGFIFLHIVSGVRTIINDYIHIEKINLFSVVLIRVCYIELIRYSMELFM